MRKPARGVSNIRRGRGMELTRLAQEVIQESQEAEDGETEVDPEDGRKVRRGRRGYHAREACDGQGCRSTLSASLQREI